MIDCLVSDLSNWVDGGVSYWSGDAVVLASPLSLSLKSHVFELGFYQKQLHRAHPQI
jgi:hypothetical protein